MPSRPRKLLTFLLIAVGLYLAHGWLVAYVRNGSAAPGFPPFPIYGKRIQYPFRAQGVVAEDKEKAQAVKDVMERTWRLYSERAWGHDEVLPVSGKSRNSRNGWGATIIDSMTTTAIMGLEEIFAKQYEWLINEVDFGKADGLVDPFETTIRYVGALVSTIDLLSDGLVDPPSSSWRKDILRQAQSLADRLGPAFDTPTGMMWPRVDFKRDLGVDTDGKRGKSPSVHLARAGSHWLEYSALSEMTGDERYVTNSTRAWNWLVFNKGKEAWPGLVESPRSITTGNSVGTTRTLGAPDDSHYEYLIKAHLLFPRKRYTHTHASRWLQAMTSAQTHLSSISKTTPPHTFLLSYSKARYDNSMGHLTCFIGGNVILGAVYLGLPDLLAWGEELVEGCHYSYTSMATGIGPEGWSWEPATAPQGHEHDFTGPMTSAQKRIKDKTGIWPIQANYMLRPEVVESYFYAWRITGKKKYQDWAWDAFVSIVNATEAEYGYSALQDVTETDRTLERYFKDNSESFWSAETLKYLYLTFSDPDLMDLDRWVFNTEAHPLKRRL